MSQTTEPPPGQGTVELGLILRNTQRAVRAAEAALEIAQRLETDFGHRFTALEGRFTALEGRVTSLAAGLNSVHRAVLRIAEVQDDHTTLLEAIVKRLDGFGEQLTNVQTRLPPLPT